MSILGLRKLENVVTEEYEKALMHNIEANSNWDTSMQRQSQEFGYQYNYKTKSLTPGRRFPIWLNNLCEKLVESRECRLMSIPDYAVIDKYSPGQGIGGHIDDVEIFDDYVCSLYLGSDIDVNFANFDKFGNLKEQIVVRAERCSVIEQFDEARVNWKREIPRRKTDVVGNRRVKRGVTYVVTLKNVV